MLTVVPTPIGNLGDLSPRALESLKTCDLIAAEDTRHTGLLLHRLGIKKPLLSFHEHNEAARTAELVTRMQEGVRVALVSDAGTPGISDPGERLVRACRAAKIPVTVLPGPCAAITALVSSGFRTATFYFGGFLPARSGGRERELAAACSRDISSIFYESPHRILKSLETLARIAPTRRVAVARELTKLHEEVLVGTPTEILDSFQNSPPKGELVLVISAGDEPQPNPGRISACRTLGDGQ